MGIYPDQKVVKRNYYTILDWVGEVGGFADGVMILFELVIMRPINSYYLKATLLTTLFLQRE